jgi:hypothetical protein
MPRRPRAPSYHVCQSLIAVGSGGITGRGFMEGMQKLFYPPEAPTDFIFANIAEELGFIGAIAIVALFVLLRRRGLRTAFRSQDPFARLAAFGITMSILLQAFFNISVVHRPRCPPKAFRCPSSPPADRLCSSPSPASASSSTSRKKSTNARNPQIAIRISIPQSRCRSHHVRLRDYGNLPPASNRLDLY